ncbi:hypothetical protein HDU86_006452 [Geranomyces michiganensis]|nr:hypothetical protein HDU86_006452 [Geranomyces michiganensis]
MHLLKLASGAVALLAAAVVAAPLAPAQPYAGQQLVRINVAANAPAETAKQLHRALQLQQLDVWDVQRNYVDVRLPAGKTIQDAAHISELVKDGTAKTTVLHPNIQQIVDDERARLAKADPNASFFSDYQPFDKLLAWYKALAAANPKLVTFVPSIGKTSKGVDIFAVRITSSNTSPTPKKQFFLQGLIHAREWVSGSTVAYICDQLVADFAKDPTLLDTAEFVFIAVVNPDGYAYTWTSGKRLWRKSLGAGGKGVDLNRNYDDGKWGQGGSSSNPSDETYRGASPASEPETKAIQNFFLAQPNLVGAIDLHSYSQLILRPYGYTSQDSPDEAAQKKVADGMAAAIKTNSRKAYSSIKSIDLYITTGTSTDFWYRNRRIYALTIELRPSDGGIGGQGFVLDPSQILPTGKEIYAAVTYWAKSALSAPLPTGQRSN